MMQHVLCVDIGGTRVRVALVDGAGQISARHAMLTKGSDGVEQVLPRIESVMREVMAMADSSPSAIAVGAPGPLDPWRGVIFDPPNLPGWHNLPLRDHWSALFGLPVHVGNDANMAALGEHRFGAGKSVDHLVYLTISTGIGGGIISEGRLLLGAGGLAGEIGHTSVEARGPRCGCGNRGCIEILAAGPAIGRRGAAAARSGASAALRALAEEAGKPVTAEMVVRAAETGDPIALSIVERAGFYIGVGVVNLAHLLNPRLVILGGGVAIGAGDMLLDPVRSAVAARAMPAFLPLPVVPAVLGDDAGLLGAAALAFSGRPDGALAGAAPLSSP